MPRWVPANIGGQYLRVYTTPWLLITSAEGVCSLFFTPTYVLFSSPLGLSAEITSVSHVSVHSANPTTISPWLAETGRLLLLCHSTWNEVSPPSECIFCYLYIDVWRPETSPASELSISGALFWFRDGGKWISLLLSSYWNANTEALMHISVCSYRQYGNACVDLPQCEFHTAWLSFHLTELIDIFIQLYW